jgi:hypothetical protein
MHFATRMVLVLMLVLATPGLLSAQETTASTTSSPAGQTATTETTATATTATTTATDDAATTAGNGELGDQAVRDRFTSLLSGQRDDLVRVLVLEPSLLTNEEFLAAHPELSRFVAAHPEVGLQPSYYLAEFSYLARRSGAVDDLIEPLVAFCGFCLFAFALVWVVRAIVEHKRWSRLARTQTEVHNKILDRFGTSAELLEYVKSSAGSRFLESAPIPVRSESSPRAQSAPLGRVLWSIQFGVVIAAAAIGMLLVSLRYGDQSGDLFGLGAVALCIGLGFIGSAAVTIFLSRRLGLWESPEAADAGDAGLVR